MICFEGSAKERKKLVERRSGGRVCCEGWGCGGRVCLLPKEGFMRGRFLFRRGIVTK